MALGPPRLGAATSVGNKLPTLPVALFFLILLFVLLIVVGDDIDCGFGHFEWDFDDFNVSVIPTKVRIHDDL